MQKSGCHEIAKEYKRMVHYVHVCVQILVLRLAIQQVTIGACYGQLCNNSCYVVGATQLCNAIGNAIGYIPVVKVVVCNSHHHILPLRECRYYDFSSIFLTACTHLTSQKPTVPSLY